MYQRLVAQFSSTLSQILLLAPASDLTRRLQEELEKHGFSVYRLSLDQLQRDPSLSRQIKQQHFYKIIALYGWEITPSDHHLLIDFLYLRHEPSLILARLDSLPLFGKKEYSDLQTLFTQQQQALNDFAVALPHTSLLIGQDILSVNICNLSLVYICHQFDRRRLFDPELNFSFASPSLFLEQTLSVIFSPYDGQKFLFQAQPLSGEKILFRLAELTGAATQIIAHPREQAQLKLAFTPQLLTGATSLKIFTQSFFNRFLNQLDSLPLRRQLSRPSSSKSAVVKKTPPADQKLLQELQTQLAAKEAAILAHYRVDREDSGLLNINIPECNLLAGQFICQARVPTNVKVPPQVILSFQHQAQNFVLPVQPPFNKKPSSTNKIIVPPKKTSPQTSSLSKLKIADKPKRSPVVSLLKNTVKSRKKPITSPAVTPRPSHKIVRVTNPQCKPLVSSFTKQPWVLPAIIGCSFFLVFFFVFFLPQNQLTQNQRLLRDFFAGCQEQTNCLRAPSTQEYLDQFVQDPAQPELTAFYQTSQTFLQQKNLLEQQLTRFYRTLTNQEVGSATQEFNLIDANLEKTLTSLDQFQTSFINSQTSLTPFVPPQNLIRFQDNLNAYKNRLLLWQKYHDLFLALIQQDSFQIALLILDNIRLLNQGGQFVGSQTLGFQNGQFSNSFFLTPSQIADKSSIKVDNPALFLDLEATQDSGLVNLPYQEKFSDFVHILDKVSVSATEEADLSLSFNFNSYTHLAATVTDQNAAQIFTEIQQTLPLLASSQKEQFFLQLEENLGQILLSLSNQDQIVDFIFTFLEEINQQEILFSSNQPAFIELIDTLNLDHQLNSRSCPSSLGGDTCYLDSFVQSRSLVSGASLPALHIEHTVTLKNQETVHTRVLNYINNSDTDVVETLAFQLPETTISTAFSFANQEDFVSNADGSFALLLPAHQTVTATLTYIIPRALEQNNFVYSFAEQKQAGAFGQNTQVIFRNTLPYSPKVIAPSATVEGKKITFNSYQDENFLGAVAF